MKQLLTRRLMGAAATACLAIGLGACTMKDQDPPPMSGPSEFGTSLTIAVSPDVLTQDGASQSVVTVTARDGNGQPIRDLALRNEISVNGVSADFGSLSARNVVTNGEGKATFVYTAPAGAPGSPDTNTMVTIAVTPLGTDFNNAVTRVATIRLVPQGNIPFPAGLQPAFTFSPDDPLEGENVFFDASTSKSPSTNPITGYAWDFGDGRTASGMTVSYSYGAPGRYFARLTVSDALGRTASTTQTVTVGQSTAPSATFVFSPTNPVTGQPINFNASASSGAAGRRIVSYTWDYGDGSGLDTRGSATTSHTYGLPRTYTVTLMVTDDLGRTDSFSLTLSVGVPSVP